jgi:hypothetical protein
MRGGIAVEIFGEVFGVMICVVFFGMVGLPAWTKV